MITQFSFCLAQAVFIIESLTTSVNAAFGLNTPKWYYAVGLMIILTPMAWVRDI